MRPDLADMLRRIVWLLLVGTALGALISLLLPMPAPPVYERGSVTPPVTASPTPTIAAPLLLATPLPSAPLTPTPGPTAMIGAAGRRRPVNQQAPYCCASWAAWVNSIEITADGLLRLNISIHNNTAREGVSFAADPMLLDENGRAYPLRRDLTITFGGEHPVAPGSSVSGALFFTAPPPEVQWVDFLYAGGYQWVRRIEIP